MFANLPTQRLSPKHQMVLPRGLRGLPGVEEAGVVWARPRRLALPDGSGRVPVIELMVEAEIQRREQAIRDDPALDAGEKMHRVTRLNGHARQLSLDGQRRVVLPSHFVELLRLERAVYLFTQNNSVLVWNPEDWLAYAASGDDDEDDAYDF